MTKAAALLFDRVYVDRATAAKHGVPKEIAFELPVVTQLMASEALKVIKKSIREGKSYERIAPAVLRVMVSSHAKFGIPVLPLYPTDIEFENDYPTGNAIVYQAILNNIPIVSPELEWKQVLDFRQDKDARRKYRSMRVWLSDALASKSLEEATDLIGTKLEDYQWALKKHGLQSAVGTITQVLDSKQLAAIAAAGGVTALMGAPIWGLLAAGSLVVAKTAIRLAERRIEHEDFKRENAAIAAIHEIRAIASGG